MDHLIDTDTPNIDEMDMDVDEVETSTKALFSSRELEKGKKRSAANLPVTVGDTLPWYKPYPSLLNDGAWPGR